MTSQNYTISDLSKEFGITTRAIRFYEDKGLLRPERRGRNRVFSASDRARLSLILRGKRVGFSLQEIRELLDLYNMDEGNVTQLRVSLHRFEQRIQVLEKQRQDIEEAIYELREGCETVRKKLAENERKGQANEASAPSAGGYAGPLSLGPTINTTG